MMAAVLAEVQTGLEKLARAEPEVVALADELNDMGGACARRAPASSPSRA